MARIFLSYRREDAADVSGRIRDRFVEEYGEQEVFIDVDSIPYGVNFRDYIAERIANSEIFVAVIGRDWMTLHDEQGRRRIELPDDPVRIEVETALKQGIPVVPLLVRKATMPSRDELPQSIGELADRNGTPIRPDPDFHPAMDRLIENFDSHWGVPKIPASPAKSARRPFARLGAVAALLVVLLLGLIAIRMMDSPRDTVPVAGTATSGAVTATQPSIDQIRSSVTPQASRGSQVIGSTSDGRPTREYSVWIDAPPAVMRKISRVEYHFPARFYDPAIRHSTQASTGFRHTYRGWGAARELDIVMVLTNGKRVTLPFAMYDAILE